MMEELTLTGATLTSDGFPTLELPEMTDSMSLAQQDHSQHNHHGHSHNHAHGGPSCCGAATPAPIRPPIKLIPLQELLQSPPSEIYKALVTLVRLGSYESMDPLVNALVAQGQDKAAPILNGLGDDGHSLLHWAAKRVDDIRFLSLLCSHVSPNTINVPSTDSVGMRPLHWACTEGSVPHIATLLRHGAELEATDKSGCTPLLIASQYGHVDLVAYLLQKGANGKAVDGAWDTALHWAAYKGSVQVCGLLVFREELSWTTTDTYGQTPMHLASLRGHTSVVRYILQESTRSQRRMLLELKDKNGKTPLDLAIQKKRPTVEVVLREAMDAAETQRDIVRQLKSTARQLCSLHSWKLWMGCFTNQDEVDETPKFPFYLFITNIVIHALWYPLVFLPFNTDQGVLWDRMGWHSLNIIGMMVLWYALFKTYTTNPGTLDDQNPKTPELRRQYEQTLESYSDEANFAKNEIALCHTCHVAKPLRSKHCRAARRCVLLFDHYCPFVGNTIGLYNYKWFFLVVLFMTLDELGFIITLSMFLHRMPTMQWGTLMAGLYLAIFTIPALTMCIYHSQLMMVNLTTNEHQNVRRYKYLQTEHGRYHNPFSRGYLNNILDRLTPSEASYSLPATAEHEMLLRNSGHSDDVV